MNEAARAFHMEEYKQLKQEMAAQRVRMEILAQRCLLVAAAVFAWIAVQGVGITPTHAWCSKLPRELSSPVWLLPFGYTIFSGLGALAAYWRSYLLANYIGTLEVAMASEAKGWEVTLNSRMPVFGVLALAFWLAVLAVTLLAGIRGAEFLSSIGPVC